MAIAFWKYRDDSLSKATSPQISPTLRIAKVFRSRRSLTKRTLPDRTIYAASAVCPALNRDLPACNFTYRTFCWYLHASGSFKLENSLRVLKNRNSVCCWTELNSLLSIRGEQFSRRSNSALFNFCSVRSLLALTVTGEDLPDNKADSPKLLPSSKTASVMFLFLVRAITRAFPSVMR